MSKTRNLNLTKKYLELIKEGLYPAQIAKILKVSSNAVNKKLKQLEKSGLIRKQNTFPVFYHINPYMANINLISDRVKHERQTTTTNNNNTSEKKNNKVDSDTPNSLANKLSYIRDTANQHCYKIKIPILKFGSIQDSSWKKKKVKNWFKYFKDVSKPIKMKIEITTKSIILTIKAFDLPANLKQLQVLTEKTNQAIHTASDILYRHNFRLDTMNAKVIDQHLAYTSDEFDKKVEKGDLTTLNLNRSAKSILGTMKQKATAWIDKSKGVLEQETNDLTYSQQILQMPISIENIESILIKKTDLVSKMANTFSKDVSVYSKNIEMHMGAVKNIDDRIDKLTKTVSKIDEGINQFTEAIKELNIYLKKSKP